MTVAIKERPILFSGEMVKAILAGRKTQTRRAIKPQPPHGIEPCHYSPTGWAYTSADNGCTCKPFPYRWGPPGLRLWVRETWCQKADGDGRLLEECWYAADGIDVRKLDGDGFQEYRKDGSEASPWCPSIHMPRWASRITLEITGVRVERLHAISEEDAKAEGADGDCPVGYIPAYMEGPHRYHFAQIWERINGAESWAANPWVWVLAFKRIQP